jgi:predicted phage-related endonuclease
MDDDPRRYRKETQLLSSESAWLQKALFALQKALDTRAELSESRSEAIASTLSIDGRSLSMEDFQEGIENRIKELLDEVQGRRTSFR